MAVILVLKVTEIGHLPNLMFAKKSDLNLFHT
jgi:hypothetical protein